MCQICWEGEELLAFEEQLFYGISSDIYTSNDNVQRKVIMSFSLLSYFLVIYEHDSYILVQAEEADKQNRWTKVKAWLTEYQYYCMLCCTQI
jgi:hypothetical protein